MLTIAFVLFALHIFALASPLQPRQDTIKIALSKRSALSVDNIVDPAALEELLDFLDRKYKTGFAAYQRNTGQDHPLADGLFSGNTTIVRRATGIDTLIDDNEGQLWQGNVSVGTPAQSFTVDFDTGSSDFFLPGPSCTTNCDGHKSYKPALSSTAVDNHKSFNLAYGDGSNVQGEQYNDTVILAGLTAKKQTLGAASKYSSGFSIGSFPPDGLLGMAYQSISVYNSPPVFETLVAQGQATQPLFAFKFAKTGSELSLGGVDSSLFTGNFVYAPVTTKGYWQVTLDAVSVNGKKPVAGLTQLQSVIDTGTTLIVGNAANVRALYASIPGSKDASKTIGSGYYTVPCDAIPTVSFTFGGKAFNVSPSLFNLGRVSAGSKDCVGAIVASNMNFWVVGDVFLQNVYTSFDMGNNRVGFATLK